MSVDEILCLGMDGDITEITLQKEIRQLSVYGTLKRRDVLEGFLNDEVDRITIKGEPEEVTLPVYGIPVGPLYIRAATPTTELRVEHGKPELPGHTWKFGGPDIGTLWAALDHYEEVEQGMYERIVLDNEGELSFLYVGNPGEAAMAEALLEGNAVQDYPHWHNTHLQEQFIDAHAQLFRLAREDAALNAVLVNGAYESAVTETLNGEWSLPSDARSLLSSSDIEQQGETVNAILDVAAGIPEAVQHAVMSVAQNYLATLRAPR